MTRGTRLLGGALVALAPLFLFRASLAAADAGAPAAGSACTDLAMLALPDAAIVSATEIQAPFTVSRGSGSANIEVSAPFPFCRVVATLTPSKDSDIHAEVWLPSAARWNGRFLGVGNGALTGSIWYTSMVRPLQRGYAVAGSDLGHTAPNADWAIGHPEKLVDYAHRADHAVAVAAKAVVAAHYGQGARFAYFHGCSNGGHQALMEAQRYPDDYNGIIAGAPWNSWTHQVVEFAWRAQHVEQIDKAKLPMITRAAVAQCAGHDGGAKADTYLNDPRVCRFDPAALKCNGPDGPTCLTAPEVEAVRRVYEGPVEAPGGKRLFPGFERGSETNWSANVGSFTTNLYRSMINPGDTSWDVHGFDFRRDADAINRTLGDLINSDRTDMQAFRSHGGKVLMWHGWTDTTLEPRQSIAYYNRLIAAGQAKQDAPDRQSLADTQSYIRLFMAPGVNHCGGGEGPGSTFAYTLANAEGPADPDHDALAALERWVEAGTAPETLISSHTADGRIDRSRPLCAYPKVARYRGTGDVNQAGSFVCADDLDHFRQDFSEAVR